MNDVDELFEKIYQENYELQYLIEQRIIKQRIREIKYKPRIKIYKKKMREKRKQQGLCIDCGKKAITESFCEKHRNYHINKLREYYQKNKIKILKKLKENYYEKNKNRWTHIRQTTRS